ncbi:MAG: cell wall hydrolase [Lachnospiraceae bacterium]|nr:cell wall hydrolase [Lachnospiraceae bacterium]
MKSTIKQVLAVLMFLVMVITVSTKASYQVQAETTLEKLQKAQEEKKKTEEAMGNQQDAKEALEITQNSLLGELSSLNDELLQIGDNLEQIESDIDDKQQEIADTQQLLEEAIQTENEQYEAMKERIRFMYEAGESTYLELIFSAKSFGDFLNKSEYIESINEYDRKMLSQYKETRELVTLAKAQLDTELLELEGLEQAAVDEQARVSVLVSDTSKSVAKYESQIADAEKAIADYEAMLDEQEEDIAALQKQYEEELALSKLAAMSAWRDVSEVVFAEGDRYLLANLIYCEAGGEPYEGQVAVGAVVMNRVLSSKFPDTIAGVIYQKNQFSPVKSGRLAAALAVNKATAKCYKAADEAMAGVTNVGQCLFFRTPKPGLTGISIGGHIFY